MYGRPKYATTHDASATGNTKRNITDRNTTPPRERICIQSTPVAGKIPKISPCVSGTEPAAPFSGRERRAHVKFTPARAARPGGRGTNGLWSREMRNAAPAPSPEWCLFLDVDGTLVEIADTPSSVVVDPSLEYADQRRVAASERRACLGERPKHRDDRSAVRAAEAPRGRTARRRTPRRLGSFLDGGCRSRGVSGRRSSVASCLRRIASRHLVRGQGPHARRSLSARPRVRGGRPPRGRGGRGPARSAL